MRYTCTSQTLADDNANKARKVCGDMEMDTRTQKKSSKLIFGSAPQKTKNKSRCAKENSTTMQAKVLIALIEKRAAI